MRSLRYNDLHVILTYESEGEDCRVEGDLEYLDWSTEDNYSSTNGIESTIHNWRFVPNGGLTMSVGKTPAVKGITRTAEIEASGSTLADFEQARMACNAPKDALIEINRWSYPEAIRVDAGTPVKILFTWEE